MPVRHRIENLTRRGNVYYWRARVPRAFLAITDEARLSMSLRLSDYQKAGLMARRLNTYLAALAHSPDAMTTTKDKLNALCQAERDRMAEQLDDIAMVARRRGRARENEDIAHDLIAGWSCRLMAQFGFLRDVSFDPDCPARGYLASEGIANEAALAEIKANFDRDRKGFQSPVFDNEMAAALRDHAIDDTPANRERAKMAYFQGRADALMDYASRQGLPHETPADLLSRALATFESETPVEPKATIPAAAVAPELPAPPVESEPVVAEITPPQPSQSKALPDPRPHWPTGGFDGIGYQPTIAYSYGDGTAQSGGDVDGGGGGGGGGIALWKDPSFHPPSQAPVRDDDWDPDFFDDAHHDVRLDGAELAEDVLPLNRFPELVERIKTRKEHDWTKETASDFVAAVNLFVSVLEEHGVRHSGEIKQKHLAAYRHHLNEIPPYWGKSPRLRALSARELREVVPTLKKEAEEKQKQRTARIKNGGPGRPPKTAIIKVPKVGLNPNTIRKHFGNIKYLLEGIHAEGNRLSKMTFRGLRPKKPSKARIRANTVKVGPEDLKPIFLTGVFTGGQDIMGDERLRPGPHVFHDSLYWLPMLYVYLGARRAELAYLMTEDMEHRVHDGWVVHIRENKFRRLKNLQSHRVMPLPKEVIRLGFIDYWNAIKAKGSELLFPDLCNATLSNDLGTAFYNDFQMLLVVTLEEKRWNRAIHALRHGFADMLKQAGVSTEQIDELSGRMGETETSVRYTAPQSVELQRKLLDHLPNLTAHLRPHPIRLAPWVENGTERPSYGRLPKKPELPLFDDISDSEIAESDSD